MERPISPKALAEVHAALFEGNKIAAIRLYREDTRSSLKDAKEAVGKIEAELRASAPEKFKAVASKQSKGCGICLAVIIFLVFALIFFLVSVDRG